MPGLEGGVVGYPLTGWLYSDFRFLDAADHLAGHEMYLVKPDGTYEVVEKAAQFLRRDHPGLDPDDGVWLVDRRERLFAFRIETDDDDVVASVRAALVDVREAFGADLTDGVERLVRYFRRLPLPSRAKAAVGGDSQDSAMLIGREVNERPPQLPGVAVLVEFVQPYREWARTRIGELVEVRRSGDASR